MKYCIDCEHYDRVPNNPPVCKRTWTKNPVDGSTEYEYCSTERLNLPNRCGPMGGHWQKIRIPAEELDLAFPPRPIEGEIFK